MFCFHKYVVVRNTGYYKYVQCSKCYKRDIEVVTWDGYSPVDTGWINNGIFKFDNDKSNAPPRKP